MNDETDGDVTGEVSDGDVPEGVDPGHPDDPDLGELFDVARAQPSGSPLLRTFLDRRPDLADRLAWLADLQRVGRALPRPPVSASLLERLRALGPDGDVVSLVVRADSRSPDALVGLRGAADGDDWSVVVGADDLDLLVDAHVRPDGDLALTGELLVDAAPRSLRATVRCGGRSLPVVSGGALGFTAEPVPPGLVTVELDVDGVVHRATLDAGW